MHAVGEGKKICKGDEGRSHLLARVGGGRQIRRRRDASSGAGGGGASREVEEEVENDVEY